MQKIKAVIFDLDGTLLNSLEDLACAMNYALRAYNYPEHTVEEIKAMVGSGLSFLVKSAAPGCTENDFIKMKSVFIEYYNKNSQKHTKPYGGIIPLLSELKSMGIKLGVDTNKPDVLLKNILTPIFGDIFDAVTGQIDGLPTKPDPTLTLSLIKKMGIDPCECAFVGDSDTDMQTAVNAGVLPIGAAWGYRSRDIISAAGAKYIADSPDDILNILNLADNNADHNGKD